VTVALAALVASLPASTGEVRRRSRDQSRREGITGAGAFDRRCVRQREELVIARPGEEVTDIRDRQ
jgi:hypothetical protein